MWKILIVDDNAENCQLMSEILRDLAKCDSVASGKEAIEVYAKSLETEPYSLILLDIEMPEIDGLSLLRKIRESERERGIEAGEGIPIIMVTVHKRPFLDAFYQGCTDYILKPFNPLKLIEKIEQKLIKFQ